MYAYIYIYTHVYVNAYTHVNTHVHQVFDVYLTLSAGPPSATAATVVAGEFYHAFVRPHP